MFKKISTPIAIGIILTIAIIIGGIYWCFFYFPEIKPGEIKCEAEKDCVFAYTGKARCVPCDLSDNSFQCVSPDIVEKLGIKREIRKFLFGQYSCKVCANSPLWFRCVCDNGTCVKTAECKEDKDCYSGGFYKCKNKKCTYSYYEYETEYKTADWKIYKNEDYRVEIKYPFDYEIDQSIPTSSKNEMFSIYKKDSLEDIIFSYVINKYSALEGDTCCGGCKFEDKEITIGDFKVHPIIHSEVPSRSSYYYLPHSDNLEECEKLPLIEHQVSGEICVDENFNYQSNGCKEGNENFFHQFILKCKGKNFEGIQGKEKCSQLFNQIISTLKFNNQEQKTYKNKDYGYKIKYPNDWKMSKNILGVFDIYKDFNKYRCSVEIYANKESYLYPIEEEENYFQGFTESKVSIKKEEVSIGNISAIKISSPQLRGREIYFFEKNIGSMIYFGEKIEGKDYFFNIFLDVTDLNYNYDVIVNNHECAEIFNQIISNFKIDENAYVKELTDESICQYRKAKFETRIFDSQGKMTGTKNGEIKEEIPGSYCIKDEESNETQIHIPEDTIPYKFEILGITDGNYQLNISGNNPFGGLGFYDWVDFEATNIPIVSGVLHHYEFDWKALSESKEAVALFIDINNDGIFEKTITSYKDLTCEQFIIQLKER